MTREEYIESRRTGNFTINALYDYYVEFCEKDCLDFNQFANYVMNPQVRTVGQGFQIQILNFNKELALRTVVEYYDRKFNVFILKDKAGITLKIY